MPRLLTDNIVYVKWSGKYRERFVRIRRFQAFDFLLQDYFRIVALRNVVIIFKCAFLNDFISDIKLKITKIV